MKKAARSGTTTAASAAAEQRERDADSEPGWLAEGCLRADGRRLAEAEAGAEVRGDEWAGGGGER